MNQFIWGHFWSLSLCLPRSFEPVTNTLPWSHLTLSIFFTQYFFHKGFILEILMWSSAFLLFHLCYVTKALKIVNSKRHYHLIGHIQTTFVPISDLLPYEIVNRTQANKRKILGLLASDSLSVHEALRFSVNGGTIKPNYALQQEEALHYFSSHQKNTMCGTILTLYPVFLCLQKSCFCSLDSAHPHSVLCHVTWGVRLAQSSVMQVQMGIVVCHCCDSAFHSFKDSILLLSSVLVRLTVRGRSLVTRKMCDRKFTPVLCWLEPVWEHKKRNKKRIGTNNCMFMCSVPSLRTFLKYKMVEMFWNNTKHMNCVILFELFSLVGEFLDKRYSTWLTLSSIAS